MAIDTDEIARRTADALTAALGVQVWVSLTEEGFGISWYDGPSYETVTAAAVKLDLEEHWLRLSRAYTPWAWIWVMRRRVQSFTWPKGTTPQQAARLFEAELDELDIEEPQPAEREWTTRDPASYPPEAIAEVMAGKAEELRKAMTSDYRDDGTRDESPASGSGETRDAKTATASSGAATGTAKTRDATTARPPRQIPAKTGDETRSRAAASAPAKQRDETRSRTTAARAAATTKPRDAKPGVCGHCQGPIAPAARQGRKAVYCSTKCRQAANRIAHRQEPATARCERCGTPIQTGGTRGRPRRYCSNTCKDAAYRESRRTLA